MLTFVAVVALLGFIFWEDSKHQKRYQAKLEKDADKWAIENGFISSSE